MTAMKDGIARRLDVAVKELGPLEIPQESLDRVRNQYHSTRILRALLEEAPPDTGKILGVIDRDLFIPILTFVFGEAQLDGTASLVSLARLRQEFYGLPPDRRLLGGRLVKECLHELGHTFGLIHCTDRTCVMYLSNTVRDVDGKTAEYCPGCRAALAERTGARR